MATTAVLVDWRPAYLRSARTATSLLLSPLGTTTLLRYLHEQVMRADARALTVVPNFEYDEAYRGAIGAIAPDAEVISAAGFGAFLDSHEPSDWLLMVDARCFPTAGFDFRALLRDLCDYRLVKHLVHLRGSAEGTREHVVCDQDRRVRAIRRLYDGVTHLDPVTVNSSLISGAVARQLENLDLSSLRQLRTRLAAVGIPSRDITTSCMGFDLMEEEGLVALNERFTHEAVVGPASPPFVELAPNIWVKPGGNIHPTSRVYGPVILHQNVSIDANAVVIGATVLGAGAHIEQGAMVSHSLVGPRVRLRAGTCVVQRVLVADGEGVTRAHDGLGSAWQSRRFTLPALQGRNGNGETRSVRSGNGGGLYALAKRGFDFTAALLGLIILSPLLLLVAVLVKLTSRGPVFFSDEREGRDGQVFRCWKFRTMAARAHTQQRALYQQNVVDGPQFKLPNDPRVTWLGHWLRTTNIDELPQLYNVLCGEMSLIGPRPSPFRENQICVPWRNARLSVRPGITGLWQVCRRERSAGDFHQWIHFDTLYVRHVSYWLDFRILAATFLTLAGRWSVPLNWMIPARKLRPGTPSVGAHGAAAPAGYPITSAGGRTLSRAATTSDRGKPSGRMDSVGEARARR